jgi:hypothetical protein
METLLHPSRWAICLGLAPLAINCRTRDASMRFTGGILLSFVLLKIAIY